ncbi:hypothetical protein ACSBR2_001260 [Camellia fascicularis]
MASDEVLIPDPAIGIEAILGVDIEVEDAPALPPLIDRPFDTATYRPRTHGSPPGGILRFEGLVPGIDKDILLRIGGYRSTSGPQRWYERLLVEVRALVDASDFGPFYLGLIQMRAESLLYRALGERWWDTTDSFHFSLIRELTLTPCDFSMLTGLRVGVGSSIPCDPNMKQWKAAQSQLLGAIPDITSHGMVRYSWFYDHFSESQPATTDEVAEYTCSFLMYLLGTTLFVNRENTVGLYLLRALEHLPQVTEYDWGGAGLAISYCYVSSFSRRKTNSLGGYWRVWELWVYTYFISPTPVPVRLIELFVPRSRLYIARFEHRRVDRDFLYFRRFFDTITVDQGDWHPWVGIPQALSTTYVTTWHASTMQILFEAPFGRAYYLGERFIHQTRGIANPDIPHPPIPVMRVVDELQNDPQIDLLMLGEDGD